MRQKSSSPETPSAPLVKDIRRVTRKKYSAEEKIRIVVDGLRGEVSTAELCRREGIPESLYYSWSKEFLEAGKWCLAGDTARSIVRVEDTVHRNRRRDQCGLLVCKSLRLRQRAGGKGWHDERREFSGNCEPVGATC